MAEPYIWGNLARTNNDSTLIDGAIDEAVATHNDDPDAHLGAGQALQSHRASEIIDHLAESVVNDKIHQVARAFVALVGTDVEGDYDTIAAAVAYAASVGGGTIFLAKGTHYLSGAIECPTNINFVGADADTTTIVGDKTNGDYLELHDPTGDSSFSMFFDNLTFNSEGGPIVFSDSDTSEGNTSIFFRNCIFSGYGQYYDCSVAQLVLRDSMIYFGASAAFSVGTHADIRDCYFQRINSGSSAICFAQTAGYQSDDPHVLQNCSINITDRSTGGFFSSTTPMYWNIFGTRFNGWITNDYNVVFVMMDLCIFYIPTGRTLLFSEYGVGGVISNNRFYTAGTGKVASDGVTGAWNGNYLEGSYGDLSTEYAIQSPTDLLTVSNFSTSVVAVALQKNFFASITANTNKTLTTTVPPAGQIRVVRIQTNSTTSYTMTFGSGFRATGTLATGTTNNRMFCVSFVSDGDYLWEISRTSAITK